MKIKTSELQGAPLNWAVAKIEDRKGKGLDWVQPLYSTYWAIGGPIIEREGLCLSYDSFVKRWFCCTKTLDSYHAETALVAAMRCYVAGKLGDEVEIPEWLNNA
jgi:hypothetical protein